MDDGNVFTFGSIQGGKGSPEKDKEDGIPINEYVITDIDNFEEYARGFLIFTPHHLAIMRDEGKGAVPVLVMPINRVRVAVLIEDDDEDAEVELPR